MMYMSMAFKPIKENQLPQSAENTQTRSPELDLRLEKEKVAEQSEHAREKKFSAEQAGAHKIRLPFQRHTPALTPLKDEIAVKIEKILEENLNDSYQRLSPVAKQEFKLKGEQTAAQIRDMLKDTHVRVKKILQLVLDWLRMLPGINRFFLEQEAKIKTDRIIALKKRE